MRPGDGNSVARYPGIEGSVPDSGGVGPATRQGRLSPKKQGSILNWEKSAPLEVSEQKCSCLGTSDFQMATIWFSCEPLAAGLR